VGRGLGCGVRLCGEPGGHLVPGGTDIAELTDRLVDELIIWGDADTITARIRQQLDAGADHVILHVLAENSQPGAAEVAQHLASLLRSLAPEGS
jgi:alkanesulfonate monooxygenase SsuD/methylene tetrahydromethanopterin reductase-like flavin-dependent oxidoreductase (luciferase family)